MYEEHALHEEDYIKARRKLHAQMDELATQPIDLRRLLIALKSEEAADTELDIMSQPAIPGIREMPLG